ncbi:MAG TPA: SurA N-terminal domain-containing protein, partial [Mucilaginibacter sp.]|nr:SurA N-terminal domain-containing protein [Mucilaginibacter sp.]
MSVIGYLRERMGKILAIVIGLSLFAFILGEVLRQGSSFFRDDRNEVGEVDGQKIAYDKFSKQVDDNTKRLEQQYGQANLPDAFIASIKESTWNQDVNKILLNNEMDKIGLVVSNDEIQDMVSGENPNPQIVQAFRDPKTGQLDRARLNNFLQSVATAPADDQMKVQWDEFIDQMIEAKQGDKFVSLVSNALYVNSLDTKDDYEN